MEQNRIFNNINLFKNKLEQLFNFRNKKKIYCSSQKDLIILREYKNLKDILFLYTKYKKKIQELKELDVILNRSNESLELKKLAQKENLISDLTNLEKTITGFLRYKKTEENTEDNKNAIMEIRSGTGGNEACSFVENIFRMYTMYFKEKGWTYNILNTTASSLSGYKEVILNIKGKKIYSNLKFESGVHRVQRIPSTESQGRVHTSAITIVVLPEVEEIDFDINLRDIKRETFRSSGAGGQHVNKTESSVRLTHITTGISVECQEERSQHKNLEKAMKVLRYRLSKIELAKKLEAQSIKRKSLVSTGDRSYKIRTYNYPQNRVTDHRINKSISYLEEFMNGKIQEMIDSLKIAENIINNEK